MIILVAHNYYQRYGGEDEAADKEIALLRSKGHEVLVFTRQSSEIRQFGMRSKALFFPNTVFAPFTYSEARKLIKRRRPDLAHVHNFFPLLSPSLLHALHAEGVPTIVTAHDYHLVCPNGVMFARGMICEKCLGGNYFHAAYRKCYRQSRLLSALYATVLAVHRGLGTFVNTVDLILTPSQFARSKLIQGGLPGHKVAVKPNFILPNQFQKPSRVDRTVVYMGALAPHKGLLTLLEAWKLVPKDLTLTIVGDGVLRPALEKFVRTNELANVTFTGHVHGDSRFETLKRAAFAVVPSEWYETFCLSAVEAMALAKPVVAARVGALQDIVSDQENGLMFEMGNAADLAKKIVYLAADEARAVEMGERAKRYAEETWSAESVYETTLNIYEDVISRASSASIGAALPSRG